MLLNCFFPFHHKVIDIIVSGIRETYDDEVKWAVIYLVCEVCLTVAFVVGYLEFSLHHITKQVLYLLGDSSTFKHQIYSILSIYSTARTATLHKQGSEHVSININDTLMMAVRLLDL